jgi:DNA-binding NarL/FixJ family response regulator
MKLDTDRVTSVLVVEDDDLTRISLSAALSASGLGEIHNAKTSSVALDLAKAKFPKVALIDVHLGRGPSGVDVAHNLRKLDPRIGIVFLTSYEDPRLMAESRPLPDGSQYLLKKNVQNIEDILVAIEQSLEGKNRRLPISRKFKSSHLSDIQLETLRLIAQGMSNSEIARRRQVSEKSVEAIIRRLIVAFDIKRDVSANQRVHLARIYFESLGISLDYD